MTTPLAVYRSRLRPDWTEGAIIAYQGQRYTVHVTRITPGWGVLYLLRPAKKDTPCSMPPIPSS